MQPDPDKIVTVHPTPYQSWQGEWKNAPDWVKAQWLLDYQKNQREEKK